LIITYLPYATPRIPALAKYLPQFGWQPLIMTPPCPRETDWELEVVETPYRHAFGFLGKMLGLKADGGDLRKQVKERFGGNSKKSLLDSVLTVGGAIINYPDSKKGWKPFAVSEGMRLLKEENIDVMMTSSAPVTSHIVGRELKREFGTPWLADLRDLWSQNHNYGYGPLRRLIDRRLEVRTLAASDALLTVSQPWAEKLSALHRGKTVYTITHGFDPQKVNHPPAELTARFTITYTGSVYTKHDPSKLFAALRDLVSAGTLDRDDIEVRFYGRKTEWLGGEIERYGLSDIVRQYGPVSRDVAIKKQRESQLLLRLKWEGGGEHGAYSGKIFEYLGARRPILATGGSEDVVTELLAETGAGISALTVEDIKKVLEGLYKEYKQKGGVAYRGEEARVNKYSCREMARKLVEILDRVSENPGRVKTAGEAVLCYESKAMGVA